MSALSDYVAPALLTVALSVIVPVIYVVAVAETPQNGQPRSSGLYYVESPMGSWIAAARPRAHLNGTVSFRDFESGAEMTIDNGGVVIRPQMQTDR